MRLYTVIFVHEGQAATKAIYVQCETRAALDILLARDYYPVPTGSEVKFVFEGHCQPVSGKGWGAVDVVLEASTVGDLLYCRHCGFQWDPKTHQDAETCLKCRRDR